MNVALEKMHPMQALMYQVWSDAYGGLRYLPDTDIAAMKQCVANMDETYTRVAAAEWHGAHATATLSRIEALAEVVVCAYWVEWEANRIPRDMTVTYFCTKWLPKQEFASAWFAAGIAAEQNPAPVVVG